MDQFNQPPIQPEGTVPPTPPTPPQEPTVGNSMDGMQTPTPPAMPPQPTPPAMPVPTPQQDMSQTPSADFTGPIEAPTPSMPSQPVAPPPNNSSDQKATIGYLAVTLFWVPIVGLVLPIISISRGRRSNNKKLTTLGWVGLGLWLVATILGANMILNDLDGVTSEFGL